MRSDLPVVLASELSWVKLQNLLLDLEEPDLIRAGRILKSKDLSVIDGFDDTKRVKIALTASFNSKLAIDAFTGAFFARSMAPLLAGSVYGQYLFDVGNPESHLYIDKPTAIICMLGIDAISSRLPSAFALGDVLSAFEMLFEDISLMIERHRSVSDALLVISLPPEDVRLTKQLISLADREKATAALYMFYTNIYQLVSDKSNPAIIVTPPLRRRELLEESQRFAYAKMPISDSQLVEVAFDAASIVAAHMGFIHKALAVDLDGTLWDGIVGEDGAAALDAGVGLRGAGHSRLQLYIKQLVNQGVVLAAITKNDADKAIDGIKHAPGMILTEEDFVAIEASWNPKEWSLERLSTSLNIPVEGFVFLDDQVTERGLMRECYKNVVVPELGEDPSTFADILFLHDPFVIPEVTSEDKRRVLMYQAESKRQSAAKVIRNKEDFLASLSIGMSIRDALQSDMTRLSQLSLRTNQFHSAMLRLDTEELVKWIAEKERKLLVIEADDRFGDYGMVGMVMLEAKASCLRISNMALSCRVFSRGLEEAMLSTVINYAVQRGSKCIQAVLVETEKNTRVKELLTSYNFHKDESEESLFCLTDPSLQDFPVHLNIKAEV